VHATTRPTRRPPANDCARSASARRRRTGSAARDRGRFGRRPPRDSRRRRVRRRPGQQALPLGGRQDRDRRRPKNTTGTDGTTVVIGKSSASKTLQVFEDSRCPVCAQFEQTVGSTVQNDIDAGKFKIQYFGATFIDNSDNGTGSKNALSALGAALNVSPDAFLQYKTALYSTKYHPEETNDKFAKDSYLLQVADSVSALKNNATFQKDVKAGTFDAWR